MKDLHRWKILLVLPLLMALTACGGGGGDTPDLDPVLPDPLFQKRAEAASFSGVALLEGHVDNGVLAREVDMSDQPSGALVTVDVSFEVDPSQTDYVFSIMLVPAQTVSKWNDGNTLGEMIGGTTPPRPEELVELGGVLISPVVAGPQHVRIPVKLPVLAEDQRWRIVVSPSVDFLADDKDPGPEDLKVIPLIVDNEDLVIRGLEKPRITLAEDPPLQKDAPFTRLERFEAFSSKGYSLEPIFQTSVAIDVTTFNDEEEVELSMTYIASNGTGFEMGLLGQDEQGSPTVLASSRFRVPRTDGAAVHLPVAVFVPPQTQKVMLKDAVPIQDVGSQNARIGRFELSIDRVENGQVVVSEKKIPMLVPMVMIDSRAVALSDEDLGGFSVLRAGSTNQACLSISPGAVNPDTGKLSVDSTQKIEVRSCDDVRPEMLWRHDTVTQQLINKLKDVDGNSYCMTGTEKVIAQRMALSALRQEILSGINDLSLERCAFHQNSIGNIQPPGTATVTQIFEFEGNKIKFSNNGRYIVVEGLSTPQVDVLLGEGIDIATDIFTNTNGTHVDSDGRMFYIGKFENLPLGDEDFARLDLSFGGETFVDYLPVIGTTARASAGLSVTLFGVSADVVSASATHKRYLPRLTSLSSGNVFPVEVGNGAEARFDILGLATKVKGEIKKKTISSSFPLDATVSDALGIETDFVSFDGLDFGDDEFDRQLFKTNFVVFVVPVTIEGGLKGVYQFTSAPDTSLFGINLAAKERLGLSGYLEAGVDAALAKVTMVGTIEFISQTLNFSAGGEFTDQTTVQEGPLLGFGLQAGFDMDLKLLKGEVSAKLKYWTPFGRKTKTRTLYSSGYLFENNWDLFSENRNLAAFKF